jgi:hypothetical protein
MADIQPIFDKIVSGSGSVGTEIWVDLGAIPIGKKIFYGYATVVAEDKACQFEIRSNLVGKSTGTAGDTDLHDWCSANAGESSDRDMYWYGNIASMSVLGTGTEHWWIRVKSKGASTGIFDYILRYQEY